MKNAQTTEFDTFGIISNRLKAGLLIGLLSLSITGNVFTVRWLIIMQGDMYEKMLEQNRINTKAQVQETLKQPVESIYRAVERVDTAVSVFMPPGKTVDSTNQPTDRQHPYTESK